jgi:hypothetical protein
MFPGTSAVLSESSKDLRDHFDKGRYGSMIGDGIKQLATLPVALADDVIGGFGRGAYRTLRDPVEDAGRAALGLEDRKEPAAAPPEALRTPPTAIAGDATMPGQDPGRITLRGRSGADVAGAPGVSKFKENGRTLYSNVAGDNADMMDKKLVGVAPGMDPALIKQTLTNPDGSAWSAQDNATMAANLRDGVDPYRGTSRASKGPTVDDQLQTAMAEYADPNRARAPGRGKALRTQIETLRGLSQDASAARSARETNAANAARAQQEQANKDRTYQLDVDRYGVETANKNRDDARAGEKAFSDRISGLVGDDKDGVKASRVRVAANMFIGDSIRAAEAELRANPGNAKAARDLERLKGGPGALDDKMLSELLLSTQAQEAATEYDGMMPWSGKAKNTTAPIKSLTEKKGVIWDDYVTDSGSGNQVIPKRALRDRPDLQRLVTP